MQSAYVCIRKYVLHCICRQVAFVFVMPTATPTNAHLFPSVAKYL